MKEILRSIGFEDALIITAPPGWGKTYKFLKAIQEMDVRVCFVFPLRALCDEVFVSAQQMGVLSLNLRSKKDLELINIKPHKLLLTTPELILGTDLSDYIFILDEFHLFYYWGDSFRERMNELYFEITSYGHPIVFLTATLSEELKSRLTLELETNYSNIYHIDMGNQCLKNYPARVFYYPCRIKQWMEDEIKFGNSEGVSLIFCQYRNEVKERSSLLRSMGYTVLDCVGGEASDFVLKLRSLDQLDFIVATSVVSHGVNLPNIARIVFTYNVENLDYYLQMVGRGGRAGECFEIHTMSSQYFAKGQILKGIYHLLLKRLSNKVNKLIYCFYES